MSAWTRALKRGTRILAVGGGAAGPAEESEASGGEVSRASDVGDEGRA